MTPIGIAIEHRAPGDQLGDVTRTALDQHADRGFVTQSIAGGDGVGEMQVG